MQVYLVLEELRKVNRLYKELELDLLVAGDIRSLLLGDLGSLLVEDLGFSVIGSLVKILSLVVLLVFASFKAE